MKTLVIIIFYPWAQLYHFFDYVLPPNLLHYSLLIFILILAIKEFNKIILIPIYRREGSINNLLTIYYQTMKRKKVFMKFSIQEVSGAINRSSHMGKPA